MTNTPFRYTYSRDLDGCDEVWDIYAPGATRPFASIPFWADLETGESPKTEALARRIVAALNACHDIPTEILEKHFNDQ